MNPRKLVLLPLVFVLPSLLSAQDPGETKRGISKNLASALAETAPKFNPPPPEPPKKDPVFDEPKNDIVRLPQVVVEGVRPPVFTEREVNTDKGLAEIAVQRYFTNVSGALNAFHLPFLTSSKEELAMMMWREDERLRQMGESEEREAALLNIGDSDKAKEVRELMNGTFNRTSDFSDPTPRP